MPKKTSGNKYPSIKSGDCIAIIEHAALLRPSVTLEKPFGKLHFSLSKDNYSYGSLVVINVDSLSNNH